MSDKTEKPDSDLGSDAAPRWLSDQESQRVSSWLADLVGAGMPIGSGLRALSEEIPNKKISRLLVSISERLDAGESIEAALASHSHSVPAHLQGLIRAGVRSGNLTSVVEQYLRFARSTLDLRRRFFLSVAYPLILVLASGVISYCLLQWIIPDIELVFHDFNFELPALTTSIFSIASFVQHHDWWILLCLVSIGLLSWYGLSAIMGRPARRRLVNVVPVIGPLFELTSLARLCYLLSILLENHMPLPEALRLAGSGSQDANLDHNCDRMATAVESGQQLTDAALRIPNFPADLASLFRWEKETDAMSEALNAASEVFLVRARIQTNLLTVFIEPAFIFTSGLLVGGIAIGVIWPMLKLISHIAQLN
jgi:type II secretory pathway component PulF